MSLTSTNRTAMDTAADIIITADTVQGPGQGNWTYEDYATMPEDGKRYQIVDGVLFMSLAPNIGHQETVGEIFAYLRDHVKQAKPGKVFIAPLDVELSPKTVVQPDVLVILHAHLERISDKCVLVPLTLLSKSLHPARLDLIAVRNRTHTPTRRS